MKKNLISDIWKNKKAIAEGIKNNLFKQEHIEEIYNERLDKCKKCPFYDPEGKSDKVIFTGTPSCGSCGCPLKSKLRSLSTSCPEGKWGPVTDEDTADQITNQIEE